MLPTKSQRSKNAFDDMFNNSRGNVPQKMYSLWGSWVKSTNKERHFAMTEQNFYKLIHAKSNARMLKLSEGVELGSGRKEQTEVHGEATQFAWNT